MSKTSLLFLLTAASLAAPASADEAAARKAGCMACHTIDKKLVGPAYKEVAAKYRGRADAVAKLSDKVRKGGQGVWGPVPMPPNPANRVGEADLRAIVQWILKS